MRRGYILFFILFGLMANLFASDEESVASLFTKRADEVVKIVENKTLAKENRNEKIVQIISPMFDFKLMAKLSLGKHSWRSLTPQKQDEFTNLYVKRMKTSYSSKVDNYTDEKIVIETVKKTKPTRIVLTTSLVGKDKKTEVIYKYYKPKKPIKGKDRWLVYDVVIIGVSIIKTDRAQFREVLKRKTIDQLMDKLRS